MKLFSKLLILVFILAGVTFSGSAQEYIIPLESNHTLKSLVHQTEKKGLDDIMLELPIEDDFSYDSSYPSENIWADNYVFINNGYAVNPPSIGVATMDALDSDGSVYSFATISPETFDADFLTSHPVNLNYPASDSIYLSFYYQPMGTGLEPYPADSLCLDFYNPDTDTWKKIWGVPGDTVRPFKLVMVPITDTLFLKEGFRFGFRNKASLPSNKDYKDKRGNVDHWNIDYMKLARNRLVSDTIIRDVAFSSKPASMLKKYESLPWDHFTIAYNTFYLPYITINYFNNDSALRNITRNLSIKDEVWNETYAPGNPTTQDISPQSSTSYGLTSIYPFQFTRGDTAVFKIKTWIRTDEFDNKANDTVYRLQVFKDYFAYDDGSAERAYGLRGQGTNNGLIAVRFKSFIADELGGVDIHFTQLKDSLNLGYFFKFMVWDDNDGMPGEVLYEGETDYNVVYSDILNKYVRFQFENTIPINGTFYVGVLQYNQFSLNIGLDINNPADGNLIYSLGSEWQTSAAPGSLMIRPYVQRSYSSVQKELTSKVQTIKIWPNPANDFVRFESPYNSSQEQLKISIFDITGKKIKSYENFYEEIYTGDIPEGLYIVTFT
ncbi:MAG: T9SS type A sorting domain-containing protein [Bacteroidales bacterium]|nr:T9SS type A sorting domain-containing protein [Bacteroidales bacterium]